jgi:GNAT superfamily N-acetyltransferase
LLRRLTADGTVPGLLAYRGDEPIGWVSVAPREQFPRVLNSTLIGPRPGVDEVALPSQPHGDQRVWAVVCFWAPPANRGGGIGDTLLRAALDHAYAHGATMVEGYPVDTSQKWPGRNAIYFGTVNLFARAGFSAVRRPSERRAVMQHREPEATEESPG